MPSDKLADPMAVRAEIKRERRAGGTGDLAIQADRLEVVRLVCDWILAHPYEWERGTTVRVILEAISG
jgi:hypothetical protein